MSFEPRRLTDGRICCSNPSALCDKCSAHHRRSALGLRRAAAAPPDPYATATEAGYRGEPSDDPRYDPLGAPPDPYQIALAIERARNEDAGPPVATQLSRGTPPDGYAIALVKLRSAR